MVLPQVPNYATPRLNPLETATQSLQFGQTLSQLNRQQQMQRAQAELAANPTHEGILSLVTQYPELVDSYKKVGDMRDEERRRNELSVGAQAYAALVNGQPDIARKIMEDSAEAYRNSGDEEEAAAAQKMAEIAGSNSPQALYAMGVHLAKAMGPDKFGQTLAFLRESELAPEKIAIDRLRAETSARQNPGGATGELIDRLMKETGMSFSDALYQVQSGNRRQTQSTGGVISPLTGAPEALGKLSAGEERGIQGVKLEYAAPQSLAKGIGAGESKQLMDARAAGDAARISINVADNLEMLLNQGVRTGKWAELRNNVAQVADVAGLPVDADLIANTETYLAVVGNLVGQVITQFGSGTGLSNQDANRAYQIAGGNLANGEQALRQILKKIKNASKITIKRQAALESKLPKGTSIFSGADRERENPLPPTDGPANVMPKPLTPGDVIIRWD